MSNDSWGPGHYELMTIFSLFPFQAEPRAWLLPYAEWPPSPVPEPPCRPNAARQWPETSRLAGLRSWPHAQPASVPACFRPMLRTEPFWYNPQLLRHLPSFCRCLLGGPAPCPPQLPWHGVFWGPGHPSSCRLQGVLKGPDTLTEFLGKSSHTLAFWRRSSLSRAKIFLTKNYLSNTSMCQALSSILIYSPTSVPSILMTTL